MREFSSSSQMSVAFSAGVVVLFVVAASVEADDVLLARMHERSQGGGVNARGVGGDGVSVTPFMKAEAAAAKSAQDLGALATARATIRWPRRSSCRVEWSAPVHRCLEWTVRVTRNARFRNGGL